MHREKPGRVEVLDLLVSFEEAVLREEFPVRGRHLVSSHRIDRWTEIQGNCQGRDSIGVDEFDSVGEVLEHLLSEAERFLQEQFTYRGLEVEFGEARSDAEEGAG